MKLVILGFGACLAILVLSAFASALTPLATRASWTIETIQIADTGIALLPPRSARCVGTARVLYSRILDRIEAADYDVFATRARVPTWRKAATAARILLAGPPQGTGPADRSRSHVSSSSG